MLGTLRPTEREGKLVADLTAISYPITQDYMHQLWLREIEHAGIAGLPQEYIRVLELEASGGPCPQCGVAWKPIEVASGKGQFVYHSPACRCYTRCPGMTITAWRRYVQGDKLEDPAAHHGQLRVRRIAAPGGRPWG